MPNPTYQLITSTTLASPTATVTFSAIPQTFNDIVVKATLRDGYAGAENSYSAYVNSSSNSVHSFSQLRTSYAAAVADGSNWGGSTWYPGYINGNTSVSNVFSYFEYYIAGYSSTSYAKSGQATVMLENNTTAAYGITAGLYFESTDAITSFTLTSGGSSWATGCTFYLFGIKNS